MTTNIVDLAAYRANKQAAVPDFRSVSANGRVLLESIIDPETGERALAWRVKDLSIYEKAE